MELNDINLLIWDVDGVLLYVRESYRKSIAEGVSYYFSELLGLKVPAPLMTPSDTQHFKLVEGFNDDWKLTYAAVLCNLVKLVHDSGFNETKDYSGMDLKAKVLVLKEVGAKIGKADNLGVDLGALTTDMRKRGAGLDACEATLRHFYGEPVVEVAKRIWFKDVIKRVFQEMYLGEDLFFQKYYERPCFLRTPGLISQEKPLVSQKTLEKLSKRYKMGVATGRDRFEAEFSLRLHGFDKFLPIEFLISSEDVSHGKPDPEPLLKSRDKLVGKFGLNKAKAAYIGDSVDDIRAAKKAGFYSIGCLFAVPDKKDREAIKNEFMKLDCDLVLDDANKLGSMV